MSPNAICKLCGSRAKLVRKSHIIPNFMYNGVYDSRHRMVRMNLNGPLMKTSFVETGVFEKYVLCEKCENVRISQLEKYVSRILYGGIKGVGLEIKMEYSSNELEIMKIGKTDYSKFKLFLLSILWRAHISTQRFFSDINIGEHEPIIKKMIIDNDAGEDSFYKIVIIGVRNVGESLINFVKKPYIGNGAEGLLAVFPINGFIYFISLAQEEPFPLFEKFQLKSSGDILIPLVNGNTGIKLLKAIGTPEHLADYLCQQSFS